MERKIELRSLLLRGVLILCICLFGVSLFFLPEIVARYRTLDGTNDKAQVANFVFDTNFTQQVEQLELSGMQPGQPKSFTFMMTNADGGSICEVALSYRVLIEGMGNLPYTVSITEVDQYGNKVDGGNAGGNSLTGKMAANQATTVYYQVTVDWPEQYKDADFAQMVDVLTLRVTCEQED